MDPFLLRLLIAVFVWFFFNMVIEKFVTKPEPKKIFEVVLIITCICFVAFGAFLPFKLN